MRVFILWTFLTGSLLAAQTVVVVVDDSGSMVERMSSNRAVRRIDAAKQALQVVLEKLPSDAQVGVLALNTGWLVPLQPLSDSDAGQRIQRLRARGATPLGEFMQQATDELLKRRADQTYGDYRLLVVTDGEASDQDVLDAVLPDIMSRGITVDVIGVDMQSDHSLATQVHRYRRADDPDSLQAAIAESLAESGDTDVVGGESDFELLEGFPADLAPLVLTALSNANNTPIGAVEEKTFPPLPRSRTVSRPVPSQGRRGGGVVGVFGAAFCMGFAFFLVAVIGILMKAARRG